MIKEILQTIGQALTSKPINEVKPVVKAEKNVGVESFLFNPTQLTGETSISNKLLQTNIGWVYKNNDVIAKEVATIEFELFSFKVVGDEIVFTKIVQHKILDALDKFNEYTDSSSGFYITQSHRKLAGDCFWYIARTGLDIEGLYILPPDKITVLPGRGKHGQIIVDKYEYKDSIKGDNVEKTYTTDEVIHFKIPNPGNPLRGKSAVEAAAEEITTDSFAMEANKGLFKRGLINNFVLSTPKSLTQEQKKQLRAELRSNYSGVSNAYKTLILSGDLKPETINMTSKDVEFIKQQEWFRDKITSIFGNTKAVIGVTDDVNRANAEAGITHWKRTTVKSEMKAITDTLNEFLVPLYGNNLVLTFKDPVPEDMNEKSDYAAKLKGSDIISTNEAREMLGFEPIEGGDEMGFQRSERQMKENIPPSVKNVNYQRVLRKSGVYTKIAKSDKEKALKQEFKAKLRPIAKKIVENRQKRVKKDEPQKHPVLTNDEVWAYFDKQMLIADVHEKIFEAKVINYITSLIETSLGNVPDEIKNFQKKELFNEDEWVVKAVVDFKPILLAGASLAGQHALELLGSNDIYLTTDIDKIIEKNIRRFTKSMLRTDRDKLIDLIAQGISDGSSIPKIRNNILAEFETYTKTQADRIARSEVIRSHNDATLNAWQQMGIVKYKQWLTARDERVCPYCAPLDGKVLPINENFFNKGDSYLGDSDKPLILDYTAIKSGNLHVLCRCTILPLLENKKSLDITLPSQEKALREQIAKLEKQIEAGKDVQNELVKTKQELSEYKGYTKGLESYLGVADEPET